MLPQGYETDSSSPSTMAEAGFTDEELGRLTALRARFEDDQDLFSDRELARLRFMRWMVETGRIES